MTTYTEEGCPFKDDCSNPYHNHVDKSNYAPQDPTIDSEVERIVYGVGAQLELQELDNDKRKQILDEAAQTITNLIAQEAVAARIDELLRNASYTPTKEREKPLLLGLHMEADEIEERVEELAQLTADKEQA